MEVSYVASIARSEEGLDRIVNHLIHQVSKSELSSFIKRLSFYIEHVNIINKSLKSNNYESQITVLNNLKTKLQEESDCRSLSINTVAKSYQESM
ncbi:MAG: hypothetical protein PHE78_00590 [Candidatus Gastranaerophilales bacterium]|jgi:capsular polysaccharide biosynthesis protein|nr:hypothetical protein [Candidatus Gastranaerophilales bacterium]